MVAQGEAGAIGGGWPQIICRGLPAARSASQLANIGPAAAAICAWLAPGSQTVFSGAVALHEQGDRVWKHDLVRQSLRDQERDPCR